MNYKVIIFDVDATLLNYDYAELNAFINTMKMCNINCTTELKNKFLKIVRDEWDKYELDCTEKVYVQNNYHDLYYEYAVKRFIKLKEYMDTNKSASEINTIYLEMFANERALNPYAADICRILSKKSILAIATNGLTNVQYSRLSILEKYLQKIFISEEVGAIKPTKAFFKAILDNYKEYEPSEMLMVGDSLTSDIKGAFSANIHTCWYNPNRKINNSGVIPNYEIYSLEELLSINTSINEVSA